MDSKKYSVVFLTEGKNVLMEEGTSILEAFYKANLPIDAPCGGNGTCGKCLVGLIAEDGTSKTVHACKTYITENITIDNSNHSSDHQILQGGSLMQAELNPMIRRVRVNVKKAQLGDHRSEWEHLSEAISCVCNIPTDELSTNIDVLSSIYNDLARYHREVDVFIFDREVLCIRPVDSPLYAVGFDIGTTTVVGYLIDLETGEQIAVSSSLNPQAAYGADVIVRSNYSVEHGVQPLTDAIRKAISAIIESLASSASINKQDIYLVSIVGNTCMHHLFLGISPASLVYAAYNPAIRTGLVLNASALGIDVNQGAKIVTLPNIASFLGADTVSAILASGVHKSEELTLLIDIGTNGEIVLGNREGMIACSTAAGPAFEGAHIGCGMRGADGAIDHVSIIDGSINYNVIGDKKPIGICGSGLLDIVAMLIKVGLIDETGRLLDEYNSEISKDLCSKVREVDGIRAFVIVEASESGNNSPIYVTQKDIREIQLAKGAISAGIELLTEKMSIKVDDIERVLIAGAFGNYMSPENACIISLIPPTLKGKIQPIGNAAGEGAKRVLINSKEYEQAQQISLSCDYLELAAQPAFQDTFIDCLSFPDGVSDI